MYIKDLTCISPQLSFDKKIFSEGIKHYEGLRYKAVDPNYMDLIPHNLLRRMGRVVKLGISTGITLLQRNENLNGIIIGTGYGGLDDCFKFLHQIIQYNEGTLTPTNFVQSTPSAVAGNLALASKNSGYNSTHVNGGLSFENVLLDALLLLKENPNHKYMVGCADELSDYNFNINKKLGMIKTDPCTSKELLSSQTKGTVNGEGAAMFIVDNQPENALSEILDLDQISYPTTDEIKEKINNLLLRNNLQESEIDAVLLGKNGDVDSDLSYQQVQDMFRDAHHLAFKHLVGDFQTASGFALWLTCNILNDEKLPEGCILKTQEREIKTVLIYNHYQREQHSFMLVKK